MDPISIFGYVLAVSLSGMFFVGASALGWMIGSVIQTLKDGFALQAIKPIENLNADAREAIKEMRAAQDRARLDKIRTRAKQNTPVTLPGMPAKHEPDTEPMYLICCDPLSDTPTYFHSIKHGYFSHIESEHIRPEVFMTDLRSCAHRMTLADAGKALRLLRSHYIHRAAMFIVPEFKPQTLKRIPMVRDEVDVTDELNLVVEE